MKIDGLTVNTKAIGKGLYDMIVEKGEEAIVAFGMIPKWSIDLCEQMMREKIIAIKAAQMQVAVDDLRPHVDKKLMDAIVNPLIREISTEIYSAAKEAGKMLV